YDKYFQELADTVSFNETFALSMINATMLRLGGEMRDGIWFMNDSPVNITLITNNLSGYRDTHTLIPAVRRTFEKAGFAVNVFYYDTLDIFDTDERDLEYHASLGILVYYSDYHKDFLRRLVMRSAPENKKLYTDEGNWVYEDPELDEIARKLEETEIMSEDEDLALIQEGHRIMLERSYMTTLVAQDVYHAKRKEISGAYPQRVSGLRNFKTLRSLKADDGTLVIGTERTIFPDDYLNQMIVSDGNIYRMDMKHFLVDSITQRDPNTFVFKGYRISFGSTLFKEPQKMPEDAFFWDFANDGWIPAEGTYRMTLSYNFSDFMQQTFHDGSKISWADVLYHLGDDYKDTYGSWSNRPHEYDKSVRGYRIDGNMLVVYLDEVYYDPSSLVETYSLDPIVSHSGLARMVDALDMYNYSSSGAFDGTDPVHVDAFFDTLDDLDMAYLAPFVTVGNTSYLTAEELADKKEMLKQWYQETGVLYSGTGAYYLEDIDKQTGTITLKSFSDY
ncbi:MAG: hypothetical protein ACOCWQ_02680, partial [Nanoarchaeota archaeon]